MKTLKLSSVSISGWTRILTGIAVSAALLQTIYPEQITFSISMTVVALAATLWKQLISVEIRDKGAIYATIILTVIYVLGGVNEWLDIKEIEPAGKEKYRQFISAAIGLLNIFSKSLFPTYEAKVIERKKAELST